MPNKLEREHGLAIGQHVEYTDKGTTRDALITIIFANCEFPPVSLAIVRAGERGIMIKTFVAHESRRRTPEDAYWKLPNRNELAHD